LYLEQLGSYERLRDRTGRALCPAGDVRWYDLGISGEQQQRCEAYRRARLAYLRERVRNERVELPPLPDTGQLFAGLLQPFAEREAGLRAALEQNTVARHVTGIRARVPGAIRWLLGVVATSLLVILAWRAALYFLVAPAVARRAPVLLQPAAMAPPAGGRISRVSQPVVLGPCDELLVHHRYLQSVSTDASMNTRWVLSWRYPLSSLAARLVALTRIRSDVETTFVISATERDAVSEIGRLDLPPGTAMVLQPRALVGVLQPREQPLRITRHWRLGTLGAWLTLQLRYLVFHGPATLLVKGARGVRLEKAESGRAISQAATLGFSANVAYSQVRTETFFPYLIGRQPLFNDRFAAAAGVYLYEETTGDTRGRGASRPLGGFLDALLKIFGI
jgi:hypothetical protein